ncbi:MAG: DUF3072 domain-containing protein [Hydrogenophaga sp.]|nr:DUF3072 domain-containing protein [Hydrogenophaga sp.]
MTDRHTQQQAPNSNMEKDPADWVTGDEPMTGAQRSYLKTLSEEAHVPFNDGLTKTEASRRIDELQAQTGRGQPNSTPAESRAEEPEGPLESLGRAISETVLGSDASVPAGETRPETPGRRAPN